MLPLLTVGEYTHVAPDAFVRGTRFACVADECIRRYVSKQVADATPHASLATVLYLTAYSFTPTAGDRPPPADSFFRQLRAVAGHQISRPL